jgi:hypothetical protein
LNYIRLTRHFVGSRLLSCLRRASNVPQASERRNLRLAHLGRTEPEPIALWLGATPRTSSRGGAPDPTLKGGRSARCRPASSQNVLPTRRCSRIPTLGSSARLTAMSEGETADPLASGSQAVAGGHGPRGCAGITNAPFLTPRRSWRSPAPDLDQPRLVGISSPCRQSHDRDGSSIPWSLDLSLAARVADTPLSPER